MWHCLSSKNLDKKDNSLEERLSRDILVTSCVPESRNNPHPQADFQSGRISLSAVKRRTKNLATSPPIYFLNLRRDNGRNYAGQSALVSASWTKRNSHGVDHINFAYISWIFHVPSTWHFNCRFRKKPPKKPPKNAPFLNMRVKLFMCLCSILAGAIALPGAIKPLSISIEDLHEPGNGSFQASNLLSVGFPLKPSEGPTLIISPIMPPPPRLVRGAQLLHAYYSTLQKWRSREPRQVVRVKVYDDDDEIKRDDPTLPVITTTIQPTNIAPQPLTAELAAWSLLAMVHWRILASHTDQRDWPAPHCTILFQGLPLAIIASEPRLWSTNSNNTNTDSHAMHSIQAPTVEDSITADIFHYMAPMPIKQVLQLLTAPLDYSLEYSQKDPVIGTLPGGTITFDNLPARSFARLTIVDYFPYPNPNPLVWNEITLGCMYLLRRLAGEGDYGTLYAIFQRDGVPFARLDILDKEESDMASETAIPIQTNNTVAKVGSE